MLRYELKYRITGGQNQRKLDDAERDERIPRLTAQGRWTKFCPAPRWQWYFLIHHYTCPYVKTVLTLIKRAPVHYGMRQLRYGFSQGSLTTATHIATEPRKSSLPCANALDACANDDSYNGVTFVRAFLAPSVLLCLSEKHQLVVHQNAHARKIRLN